MYGLIPSVITDSFAVPAADRRRSGIPLKALSRFVGVLSIDPATARGLS
jgi:hypothetical protein